MARINKTQLKKLQKELKTDSRIGDHLGITRQSVWKLRNSYGIPCLKRTKKYK
jgi:biotin operon repressor